MEQGLYSVAQIRAIEAAAAATREPGELMRRAGRAAADLALSLSAAVRTQPVLVLAGPGNNGGDALEVAAHLAEAGMDVVLLHLAGNGKVSPEAAQALVRARSSGANFVDVAPSVRDWALVVDGLFGIGLTRALDGRYRALVDAIAELRCPVLALDVPSGLDADTGALVGVDGVAVRATHTITFIANKPGLHTGAGRDHAGIVSIADLGIEAALYPPAAASLSSRALFGAPLRPRQQNSHKGSHGDVAVIGGAPGMLGALTLATRSALYAGAGRVFGVCIESGPALDALHPEVMYRASAGFDGSGRVLVLGPGMGDSAEALQQLTQAIAGTSALVLDADALNLLALDAALQTALAQRQAATVITPHPLEAARLLACTVQQVQADRLAAARTLAQRLQACVVLKGSGSVLAHPDGQIVINPTGNPGLATGGTGDVLAGLVGALLAQGWPCWEALVGAVWIHGAAADRLVEAGIGPIGMTAGELPVAIRRVLNHLSA